MAEIKTEPGINISNYSYIFLYANHLTYRADFELTSIRKIDTRQDGSKNQEETYAHFFLSVTYDVCYPCRFFLY